MEIILIIFELTTFLQPHYKPALSISASQSIIARSSGPKVHPTFFSTPPLSARWLSHVRQMRLRTLSADQGRVSDPNAGNWSWFEIEIRTPNTTPQQGPAFVPKLRPGDSLTPLKWHSHHNKLASLHIEEREGMLFSPNHEIWRFVEPGDIISVIACAQFPAWANIAGGGTLHFWEKFDPTNLG